MNNFYSDSIFFLPIFLMLALLFTFMPDLTRHTIVFGVSIPPSAANDPAIRKLRRLYRGGGLVVIAAGICVQLLLFGMQPAQWMFAGLMFGTLAAYGLLYLWLHTRMKRLKTERGWAKHLNTTVAVDLTRDTKASLSPLWLLLFPALLLICALVALTLYESAPATLITHWDFSGQATASVSKSPSIVWAFLGIQATMSALLAFAFFITKNARRAIDPDSPQESRQRATRFRRAWGGFVIFLGVVLNLIYLTILLGMLGRLSGIWIGIYTIASFVLISITTIVLIFRLGQGGGRLGHNSSVSDTISVREDDRFWKLGVFYYNPDDPAAWVEKRFGIGWTCNFARPSSWLCLLGLTALITALAMIVG